MTAKNKQVLDTLGKRIEELRIETGLSMNELAKRINSSHVQIANYEKDLQVPSAIILQKIAKELHTSADYLLDGFSNEELSKYFEKIKTLPAIEKMSVLHYMKVMVEFQAFKNLKNKQVGELIS